MALAMAMTANPPNDMMNISSLILQEADQDYIYVTITHAEENSPADATAPADLSQNRPVDGHHDHENSSANIVNYNIDIDSGENDNDIMEEEDNEDEDGDYDYDYDDDESDENRIFELNETIPHFSSIILNIFLDEFKELHPDIKLTAVSSTPSRVDYQMVIPMPRDIPHENTHLFVEFSVDLNKGRIQIHNITLPNFNNPTENSFILKDQFLKYYHFLCFKWDLNFHTMTSRNIQKVMTCSYCDEKTARSTLLKCHGEVNDAIALLTTIPYSELEFAASDPEAGTETEVGASSSTTNPMVDFSQINLWQVYLDESTTDPDRDQILHEILSQLYDIFPMIDSEILCSILKSQNYSLEDTVEVLGVNYFEIRTNNDPTTASNSPSNAPPYAPIIVKMEHLQEVFKHSPHFCRHPIHVTHSNKFFILLHILEGEILSSSSQLH